MTRGDAPRWRGRCQMIGRLNALCVLCVRASLVSAQVPGDPAISVSVGSEIRATDSVFWEVEPVIVATRTGRVVVSFFDGEPLPGCPRGPDNNRTVVWNNFGAATGPGTPYRFHSGLLPPQVVAWCMVGAGSKMPQRDPVAAVDLTDGTTWVGAFQWQPEGQQQILSNGIWVSRLDTLSGAPMLATWAALNEPPPPPQFCFEGDPYPLVDKPVMLVGPRPETAGRALYVAYVERQVCKEDPQIDGLLKVALSVNDGASWGGPMFTGVRSIHVPGTQPLSPAGAVLDNGRAVLAYNLSTSRSNTYVIWSDEEGGASTWQPTVGGQIAPVTVFDAAAAGVPQIVNAKLTNPSMARCPLKRVGDANHLYLAYHRHVDAARIGIYIARSTDGGATWPLHRRLPPGAPPPLGDMATQDNAAIAVDGLGDINALWRESLLISAGPPRVYQHTVYYARFHHLDNQTPHFVAPLFTYNSGAHFNPQDIGDYQWISAVDQQVYVAYCGAISNAGPLGQIHVVVRRIALALE